jgi:hypothetical protein
MASFSAHLNVEARIDGLGHGRFLFRGLHVQRLIGLGAPLKEHGQVNSPLYQLIAPLCVL